MDRTLVVCYSLTGNSRQLAQMLAARRGWPVAEIVESRPRVASGWGFMRCVLDSFLHRRPAIRYDGPDPASFANVVIVAPIWVNELAGPMRSFVKKHGDRMHRISVLTTMGGSRASNAVAEIARIAKRDPVLAESVTARQVQDGSCAAAVDAFASAVA